MQFSLLCFTYRFALIFFIFQASLPQILQSAQICANFFIFNSSHILHFVLSFLNNVIPLYFYIFVFPIIPSYFYIIMFGHTVIRYLDLIWHFYSPIQAFSGIWNRQILFLMIHCYDDFLQNFYLGKCWCLKLIAYRSLCFIVVLFFSHSLGPGSATDGTSEWRPANHINWSTNYGTGCTWKPGSNYYASSGFRITRTSAGQHAQKMYKLVLSNAVILLNPFSIKSIYQNQFKD